MKKLLIQSDDYGFTYGVTDGTIRAIKDGLIRNTGLFVNMKSSEYAAQCIKDLDVCLGIDINLQAGSPVSDPQLVPHLITSENRFRSSRQILKENTLSSVYRYLYNFEIDPFDYDEVLIETENQVKRFIELVGRTPEYINGHSIITPNTEKAAKEVAKKYNIKHNCSDLYFNDFYKDLAYVGEYKPCSLEEQLKLDSKNDLLKHILPSIKDNEINYFICHCGYIDKDLFSETSLTIQRINDVALATDKDIIEYIKKNEIELITYRDID